MASKICAALWFNNKDPAYRDKWEKYLTEARYGTAHATMDPNEINGDWDKNTAEDLENGVPNADEVWTETEPDRDSDEWEID